MIDSYFFLLRRASYLVPSPPPKDPLSKFRLDSMVQGLYTLERGAMLDCVNKLVNQVFDKIIQVLCSIS